MEVEKLNKESHKRHNTSGKDKVDEKMVSFNDIEEFDTDEKKIIFPKNSPVDSLSTIRDA
jgi:hypothetical protein